MSEVNLLHPDTREPNSAIRPTFASNPARASAASSLFSESRFGSSHNLLNSSSSNAALPAPNSVASKFSLSPDPREWGSNLSPEHAEPDDALHIPDPKRDKRIDESGSIFTSRGLFNLGFMALIGLALLMLFLGYPVISFVSKKLQSSQGGFNVGGINASGQVPEMNGNWGLIDKDTPEYAKTRMSTRDGVGEMELIFSDEFNVAGRSFYPGDDPYWEAVDLHYWGTNNLEWYDPAGATTENGSLILSLSEKETHDLHYQGGMISTWNKFCFTGGLIETSVVLPGSSNVVGLWPAIWAMGNLGRAGYGASLDGMWPYTYDSCDVGTVANQSYNGGPAAAIHNPNGDESQDYALSYLPGQRLSRCTCKGESHPGPMHTDGTYVGRSAPEIDLFEAQVDREKGGHVSQSGQWAPFNAEMRWFNNSETLVIYDEDVTSLNTYWGGSGQQTTSCVSLTDQDCYEKDTGCFAVYGFEYKPGFDDAFITWINNNKTVWTFNSDGTAEDTVAEIGARPVPQEPLYLLANLGMSYNFGDVDIDIIEFPARMYVDYIRVYQPKNALNVGCDPEDFPTQDYINTYYEAYMNPNLTTWDQYGQKTPKNSFLGECDD